MLHCTVGAQKIKRSLPKMNNYKVSCVMTTYRRFTCVERSISMFLNQDYTGETDNDALAKTLFGKTLKSPKVEITNNTLAEL